MLNINYNSETGNIVSYQEAPDASTNKAPEGCKCVSFILPMGQKYPGLFNEHGVITMKVDVTTEKLVPLVEIPSVQPNPPNAAA